MRIVTVTKKPVHEPTFSESLDVRWCLHETRAIHADREVRNVATKQNFNMQACGHQEKSR